MIITPGNGKNPVIFPQVMPFRSKSREKTESVCFTIDWKKHLKQSYPKLEENHSGKPEQNGGESWLRTEGAYCSYPVQF